MRAIHLLGSEEQRERWLPGANTFKDTGRVLVATRGVCSWAALGHAMAAYDTALLNAVQREQFSKPPASFQIVKDRS
jgi:glutaryl-CoA dehydrogenase